MRNPEYQFLPTDPAEVEAELIAGYEQIMGTTVRPASPERLFIQWTASIIVQERALTNYAANQNIPSRADGKNLDALAELFYAGERPKARAAECTMRFSISQVQDSAVLIPAGTRVTDSGGALVWETLEDAYVSIGETGVELPVRCQTAGTIGNGYAVGQINKLVDIFDYYSECRNITISDGGADEADDDTFYALLRASMDAWSTAGARGAYEYWAKQVSTEIADVLAVSPTPCVVNLYVLMQDGTIAGEEIKRAVLEACSENERRPLADLVSVEDAEVVPYDISFTYYLQNGRTKSAAAIEEAVNEAVKKYIEWQCARLGRDINPDELREYLYHTGVKRVELVSPAFAALRDGRDRTVPQVAAVGSVSIRNGGYEDE